MAKVKVKPVETKQEGWLMKAFGGVVYAISFVFSYVIFLTIKWMILLLGICVWVALDLIKDKKR